MTDVFKALPTLSDMQQIVEQVATIMLGVDAVDAPPPATPPTDDPVWSGKVHIAGSFNGDVALLCTRGFALRAAQAMEATGAGSDDDDARDALAELTNIIGGNLKSLLSDGFEPCKLSLPVIAPREVPHDGDTLLESWHRLGPDWLGVRLIADRSKS